MKVKSKTEYTLKLTEDEFALIRDALYTVAQGSHGVQYALEHKFKGDRPVEAQALWNDLFDA